MNNKQTYWTGIIGITLFALAAAIGGMLIPGYDPMSQLISESYAIDTQYGIYLRFLAYLPSGLLIAWFCFTARNYFPRSRGLNAGFLGAGIFYGLATVMVALFPCDAGCNKELIDPSISQLIHSLVGLLTYLFVPICLMIIGWELKRFKQAKRFSQYSLVAGFLTLGLVLVLLAMPQSAYIGLIQRLMELLFMLWILFCGRTILKRS